MPADPAHPFPQLRLQAGSQLSFPWVEYHPDQSGVGSAAHTFGSDGVTVAMRMLIYWEDLNLACKELLGYSWRDTSTLTPRGTPWLRRKLPWQHPSWNQLYVKRISEVRGVRMRGKLTSHTTDSPGNYGPQTDYHLADLIIHFWRPPYYIRKDSEVLDSSGNPREWTRYVSKAWAMSLNMLSRENSTWKWLPGTKPPGSSTTFQGSVGQTLTHFKVSRTWYQIPEQALFSSIAGGTTDGLPTNMVYTSRRVENPLSKYERALGTTNTSYTTTSGTNPTFIVTTTTVGTTTPNVSQLLAASGFFYEAGMPLGGCVNSPIGGRAVDSDGNWVDNTSASRFFGCYQGTLRFDGVTFTPQPLQLPPELMQIPKISEIEAVAQQQYDVTFHFDLFEPPPGPTYGTPVRGHNLFPYPGNGLWYPLLSQKDIADQTVGPFMTPFHYADLTDLFFIL